MTTTDLAALRAQRLAELKAARPQTAAERRVVERRLAGIREAMANNGYANEPRVELHHVWAAQHGFVPIFNRRVNSRPAGALPKVIYQTLQPGDRLVVWNRDDRRLADEEWDRLPTLPPPPNAWEANDMWMVEVEVAKALGGGRIDVTTPTGQSWRLDSMWKVLAVDHRVLGDGNDELADALIDAALRKLRRFPEWNDDLARRYLKMERLPT